LRFGLAVFQTQRPFDAAEDVLLISRILPYILPMSERGVEHLAFAVFFGLRHREMTELLFPVWMFVEDKQLVNFGRIIILD